MKSPGKVITALLPLLIIGDVKQARSITFDGGEHKEMVPGSEQEEKWCLVTTKTFTSTDRTINRE